LIMHRRTLLQAGIAGTIAALAPRPTHAAPLPVQPRIVVVEGNSLSANNPSAYGWPVCWPTRLAAGEWAQRNAMNVVNVAIGATGLEECFDRAPLFVDWLRPLAAWGCVVLIEGGNDIGQRDPRTGASAYAKTVRYCQDRRAAGWRVLVGTITNRTNVWPPSWWDEAKAYNVLLRESWRAFADGLVDLAGVPELGNDNAADDPHYFHDKIHYADAAMDIVHGMVERELAKVLPVVTAQQARPTSCLAFPLVGR
jgi:hypothetical protein